MPSTTSDDGSDIIDREKFVSEALLALVSKVIELVPLLPDDEAAILSLPVEIVEVDEEVYIQREGFNFSTCTLLIDGLAYRQKVTPDASRQIVSIHTAGEILDAHGLFLASSDHDIRALSRCKLAKIPRASMQKLIEDRPVIAHALLKSIFVEASILREWVMNLGRQTARTRVAHFFCELAVRIGVPMTANGRRYHLPMTQQDIGDAVGLTSVHVNRMIMSLEADNLIRRDGRTYHIPDIDALKQFAGFRSRYLNQGSDELVA